MNICVKCIVSGQVQGVFYRASTQEQARLNKVTGYARNQPDGTVEVLLCGEPGHVDAVRNWLHEGPPYAQVESVTCEDVNCEIPADFGV